MKSSKRPDIFVSAVSTDLRTTREVVRNGLIRIGCFPVEQGGFPPDYRSVEEMLREKIAGCDAMVHIVGIRYGTEPPPDTVPAGRKRRSYTQMEADIARELGIPLYLFVCPLDYPYDSHAEAESEQLKEMQQIYREEVLSDRSQLRYKITDHKDLAGKISELQVRFEQLERQHDQVRRFTLTTLAGVLAAIIVVGLTIWWAIAQLGYETSQSQETIRKDLGEMPHKLADRAAAEELRVSWAAESAPLSQLPALIGAPGRVTLDQASAASVDWKREVGNGRVAIGRLRGGLDGVREKLPTAQVLRVLADMDETLMSLWQESLDLGSLGNEWHARKRAMEAGDFLTPAQNEDYLARMARFWVVPNQLLARYQKLAARLAAEVELAMRGEETGAEQYALEDEVSELAEAARLLGESALVPGGLAKQFANQIAQAKSAADAGNFVGARLAYQGAIDPVREQGRSRAVLQGLIMAPAFSDLAWHAQSEFLGEGEIRERRLQARVKDIGIDFEARSLRWRSDRLPALTISILDNELSPSIARQWGVDVQHAMLTGFKLVALAEAFRDSSTGRKPAVNLHRKDELTKGSGFLVNNVRTAKLGDELLDMAVEFDQMAQAFDFAKEYRRSGSAEHKKLQDQVAKMMAAVSALIEPEIERLQPRE